MLNTITLKFLAIMVSVLMVACSDGAQPDSTNFLSKIVGKWEGIGFQNNGTNWTMAIDFKSNTSVREVGALISYPSLNCGGIWTLTSVSGSLTTYDELITFGQNNCLVSGQVVIVDNNNDTLNFSYTSGNNNLSNAYGTLIRVKN